ncbi:hypothetical protein R1sor_003778 [Riccia sorocarpa]|uniref:MULE transposase domain-containing protein n=1 Tax=Riccia sorocarpa TaxID=122646 RepID=A0ABD3H4R6_9MARC
MLSGQPAAPVSISDFQLEGISVFTGGERNRILVLATGRNLELLYQYRHWMADGTFKSAPQHFVQIRTIHIVKSDVVIPLVYALLPNKQKESYVRVLRILKERHSMHLEEDSVHTGVAEMLREKVEFAFNWRKLMALAFIPPADTERAFDLLCESPFFTNREHVRILAPLLDYFQDTWIGRPMRYGRLRRSPMFEIALWNQYEGTLSGLPRTNNSLEGWHRRFSTLLASSHPVIWKFVEGIKKEQSMTELKLAQLNAGAKSSKGKKKYIDLNQKILNIVSQYPCLSLDDYLSGLAARLSS